MAIRGIGHPFCCTYRGRVYKCHGTGDLGDAGNTFLCLCPQMTPDYYSYVSVRLLLESASNTSLAPSLATPAPFELFSVEARGRVGPSVASDIVFP
jgi:hypothetical protein